MTVADLLQQATPSATRAPWAVDMSKDVLGALIENGNEAATAALLEAHAEKRGLEIVEVCRVQQGKREAAYARGVPKANPT